MSALAEQPWWERSRLLVFGAGAAVVLAWLRKLRQQPWAPFAAELTIWRTIWQDGVRRVLSPSADDGTSELTLRQRLNRIQELRSILGIERNHQIDIARRGVPGQASHAGWGETTGLSHMRHLPGLVFRGEDSVRVAGWLQRFLVLPDVKREAAKLRMEQEQTPVMKDLVLIGGGHSHVMILRMLGMDPQPGVRATLVTRDVETPYSGMLPGHVAGLYTRRECHIDLNILARFAGVRLVHATALGLDLEKKHVLLSGDRPPIAYDVLSINIGSAPRILSEGCGNAVTPVKPISSFGARWDALLDEVPSWEGERRIAVVGGGAAGFEMALAVQARLTRELAAIGSKATLRAPPSPVSIYVTLFTRSGLLPQHTAGVRALAKKALAERGVTLHTNCEVLSTEFGQLRCADGRVFPYHNCIWCTEGSPQEWVGESGLQTDKHGFLLVDQHLQCRSNQPEAVFAAGDIATIAGHSRPRAGVFAVMAGMALWHNIQATLRGEKLLTYWPQASFLGLLGLGDGNCIASRGTLATEGRWLWELKDWIDRKWMWDYSAGLPDMATAMETSAGAGYIAAASGDAALSALQHATMRCGGCGAKVGATTLSSAMKRVEIPLQPSEKANAKVVVGVGDDAAVVDQMADGGGQVASVQTIDFFRSFIGDPFVFGRIATIHALSDCEAMGAVPQTALALAQLPFALEARTEEELVQLMAGAASALREAGCALVGGHTCEAKELGLGMAVTGYMPGGAQAAMRKDALQAGDALLLTKPIGTGTLFAADMRAKARGPWVMEALQSMGTSNGPAASIVHGHGALACTDVTGFGLAGHLLEMCRGSKAFVAVDLEKVPLYEGALDCLSMGITSSLQPANVRLRRAVTNHNAVCKHASYPLLFDPQTSGGLLAAVPKARADACLKALRSSGAAPHAAIIGEVTGAAPADAAADAGHITIRTS